MRAKFGMARHSGSVNFPFTIFCVTQNVGRKGLYDFGGYLDLSDSKRS